MAPGKFKGIPRCRARPFPEPVGIIPTAASVFTNPRATSFTVPSPPTATNLLIPSLTFSFTITVASPCLLVTKKQVPGKV